MDTWTSVGTREQVAADWPLAAEIGSLAVGVFEVDGELYAVDDICPHAHARLTQGFTEGCEVECPLHGATFDVTTGRRRSGPACDDLKTFPVRVVDGRIEVQIGVSAP